MSKSSEKEILYFGRAGQQFEIVSQVLVGSSKAAINEFIKTVTREFTSGVEFSFGWHVGKREPEFASNFVNLERSSKERKQAFVNELAHAANGTNKCKCTFGPCSCYFDSTTNMAVNPL